MTDCPECGSLEVEQLTRTAGPGDAATFRCCDCAEVFIDRVPEPPSEYAGDGVFAGNH